MLLDARAICSPHTDGTDRNYVTTFLSRCSHAPWLRFIVRTSGAYWMRQFMRTEPSTVAREWATLSATLTLGAGQGPLHQPHPVRTMKKIPARSATTQRAIIPKDVPTPERLSHAPAAVRDKRSNIADVFEFISLTGIWPCISLVVRSGTQAVPPGMRRRDSAAIDSRTLSEPPSTVSTPAITERAAASRS